MTIWTIGHSTRPLDEFMAVLEAHQIEVLVDVRSTPGSRRVPQFNSEPRAASLAARGIDYRWLAALGGRRRPDPASANTGWRHPAFRAYADHVATEEFADGLMELLVLAQGLRTAVMCAEVLWWRCHRRIIADVLSVLGMDVIHIREAGIAEPHVVSTPARVVDGRLTYA